MAIISPNMNVMTRAVEKAARSLIRDFGEVEQLQVSKKGPADFVSAADRRAEEILYTELSKARPDFGFLMEESGEVGAKDAESRWIIDPLDGTTNFLHGVPHWCISLALETKGEIVAGLVYDPVKDEMFRAEKGAGAFMRNRRLRVSGRTDPQQAILAVGQPRPGSARRELFIREFGALMVVFPAIRRFGAAALDLSYVAAGRYEGYWERELKPWDAAAGVVIVREAGGFVSGIDQGDDPVFGPSLMATNGAFQNEIRSALARAGQ